MINILLIGSGAREYIIIKKLIQDSRKLHINLNIMCIKTQENSFIEDYCNNIFPLLSNVHETMSNIREKITFCFIGPEAPLQQKYADYFENKNIPCIGPLSFYAQLETSKGFCRNLLKDDDKLNKHSIQFEIINNKNRNKEHLINVMNKFNKIVIKKDGLCGGKGVTVQDYDFYDKYEQIDYILNTNDTFIIEEKLVGEEFTILSMTDGNNNIQHFPPIQDNKRLLNDNNGPNTGGMGCVIDKNNMLPFLSQNDVSISENINNIVIHKLNELKEKNNLPVGYRGILYGSYIKTDNGIKIIEYNCRFGDPECIIALSLLETNFYTICQNIIQGNLTDKLHFSQDAMICLYVVPNKYPKCNEEDMNYDIYFNDKCKMKNIIFSNIKKVNNHIYSQKSRTLCYLSRASELYECYKNVYDEVKNISGNLFYRNDIGKKFLTFYEQSGVSIKNGDDAIIKIKKNILSTYNDKVVSEIGSFGGEYKLENNILVASIDGVGTKSILAKKFFGEDAYYNLGKDIVGHSINDILVQGAYPLFFLDYFGANGLNLTEFCNFIQGITDTCLEYGKIPILGGETAEMPLIYKKDQTDLIGCIIGKKENNFFPNDVKVGNKIINLHSVSPHTNGYSLLNKIIKEDTDINIVKTLLKPHKCYLNEVKEFINLYGYEKLNSMCHITGGGFKSNMKRVIPTNLDVKLYDLKLPKWCEYILDCGISRREIMEVFNCGIGFILIVDETVDMSNFIYSYEIIGEIIEKKS
tara:strand:+ start:498 stop:2750 length:2253 start_codon:yes stop_codon:yes gene_type:complete